MRWVVVAVLFLMSLLTIIDRVCVSAAKGGMARELGITDMAFGAVFSAFALGYALFQIPAGYYVDRRGTRTFLTVMVAAWSVCTALTGMVTALAPLLALRFVFGAFEAGAYPAAARANYTWLPVKERGMAQGILFSGSRLGAAVGLSGVAWVINLAGWRQTFLLLGAVGLVWALGWWMWFREGPLGARPPEKLDWSVLRSPAVPGLLAQYWASNFTIFLCFTWLLPYLRDRFGLSNMEAGFYASLPLYAAAGANWVAGFCIDALFARGYAVGSRKAPAIAGFLVSAAALVMTAHAPTLAWAVTWLAIATFGADLTLSPSWAAAIDIGGPRTGLLSGVMNMCGNLGSFASSLIFPLLLTLPGGARSYFYTAAVLNAFASYCWWRMNWRRTA